MDVGGVEGECVEDEEEEDGGPGVVGVLPVVSGRSAPGHYRHETKLRHAHDPPLKIKVKGNKTQLKNRNAITLTNHITTEKSYVVCTQLFNPPLSPWAELQSVLNNIISIKRSRKIK